GRGEARLEAVLDGAVGDGDRQVGLAGAGRAAEDEPGAVGDEFGPQDAAEERQTDGALEGKVILVDRLEEGEAGATHAALDARLSAVGDLLGDEQRQEVAVAKTLALGPLREVGVEPPHGRQVQAAKQAVEVDDGRRRRHRAASWTAGRRASRVRTYSAPTAWC